MAPYDDGSSPDSVGSGQEAPWWIRHPDCQGKMIKENKNVNKRLFSALKNKRTKNHKSKFHLAEKRNVTTTSPVSKSGTFSQWLMTKSDYKGTSPVEVKIKIEPENWFNTFD